MPALVIETPPTARQADLLPAENGDRLTSREFLRRYEGMPSVKKAELVEGIVYLGSPVSLRHAKRDALIQGWLSHYAAKTPLVEHVTNATAILNSENTPQPDASLRLLAEYGGRTRVNRKNILIGPPELTVEIAASSASIDLGAKRRVAQRNAVLEYLVWVVAENQMHWFVLVQDKYVEQKPDSKGTLVSQNFPGLVLAADRLLALDAAGVLAALEKGIKSPAHRAFIQAAGRKARRKQPYLT
jgi:Uma2 family endonuclease